jgi:hypothetical protein
VISGYATAIAATNTGWKILSWLPTVALPYVPRPPVLYLIAIVCLVAGYLVYRLSLTAHAQFGELFKSTFDQFRSKIQFDDVLQEVGGVTNTPYLSFKSRREKNQIIWRYLRWHLIRDDATGKNLTIREWKQRLPDTAKPDVP